MKKKYINALLSSFKKWKYIHLLFIVESTDNRDRSRVIPTKISPRQQVVMELLQTEKNYVAILHTILNVRQNFVFFSTYLSEKYSSCNYVYSFQVHVYIEVLQLPYMSKTLSGTASPSSTASLTFTYTVYFALQVFKSEIEKPNQYNVLYWPPKIPSWYLVTFHCYTTPTVYFTGF